MAEVLTKNPNFVFSFTPAVSYGKKYDFYSVAGKNFCSVNLLNKSIKKISEFFFFFLNFLSDLDKKFKPDFPLFVKLVFNESVKGSFNFVVYEFDDNLCFVQFMFNDCPKFLTGKIAGLSSFLPFPEPLIGHNPNSGCILCLDIDKLKHCAAGILTFDISGDNFQLGDIVVNPSPEYRHGKVSVNLFFLVYGLILVLSRLIS